MTCFHRHGLLPLMVAALVVQSSSSRADDASMAVHVDRSLFPAGYGVLSSERLMYPVDMRDWPVAITHERQLFLDDYLIAERSNLSRRLHSLKRYAGNPVMRLREKPWEQGFGHALHVLPADDGAGYRMWYNLRHFVTGDDGIRYRAPTCYAVSEDGIHWTKPDLGIFRYGDDRNNNITLPQGTIDGLLHEPADPDPNRRYKALVWHDPKGQEAYAPREGFYLYWSADGLNWQGDTKNCVMPHGQSLRFPDDQCTGVGDTTQFRWDGRLGKYIANVKILHRDPTIRMAGFCESDDLIHWSRPRMIMHRDNQDEPDTQIYEHITFPYESLWIGLVRVMHTARTGWKQVEVELSCSRDGRHWTRVCRGERFLPLGPEHAWDADYLIPGRPGAPLVTDDGLRFYYWGTRNTQERDGSSVRHNMHVGMATLRRDGFVSLDAATEPGRVITRPMTFVGKRLCVNAEIRDGGYLKAEFQDSCGKPRPGFELAECTPIRGDVDGTQVEWKTTGQVPDLPNNPSRLRIEMKNASLYSFWIE